MLLTDLVLGKRNPWSQLFDPTRIKPIAAAKDFVVDSAQVGLHFLGDLVRPADASDVREVEPGKGKIVRVKGKRSPCSATGREVFTPSLRSALISGVTCISTTPRRPGIARVTARVSTRTARS